LQFLLRAYPGALAHTDQFGDLLDALRDVKGLCRSDLTQDELGLVISSVNELEDFINQRLRGSMPSSQSVFHPCSICG
jgi:hypothetical protein